MVVEERGLWLGRSGKYHRVLGLTHCTREQASGFVAGLRHCSPGEQWALLTDCVGDMIAVEAAGVCPFYPDATDFPTDAYYSETEYPREAYCP